MLNLDAVKGRIAPTIFWRSFEKFWRRIWWRFAKKELFYAADILSDLWSKTVIDDKPVKGENIPLCKEYVPPDPDQDTCNEARFKARAASPLLIPNCEMPWCWMLPTFCFRLDNKIFRHIYSATSYQLYISTQNMV